VATAAAHAALPACTHTQLIKVVSHIYRSITFTYLLKTTDEEHILAQRSNSEVFKLQLELICKYIKAGKPTTAHS
jgi:hypothetical protein